MGKVHAVIPTQPQLGAEPANSSETPRGTMLVIRNYLGHGRVLLKQGGCGRRGDYINRAEPSSEGR
jgi:hypothetical protein